MQMTVLGRLSGRLSGGLPGDLSGGLLGRLPGEMSGGLLVGLIVGGLVGLLACLTGGCSRERATVVLETELGNIELEIYEDAAPITAGNFLEYVREGRFRGATFYRTVTMDNQPDNDIKIEVIQGGLGDDPLGQGLPPIEHETTEQTGLHHLDGTLSMARAEPGTASSEIFICIGDQPELDFGGRRNPDGQGFAAFGRVVRGMDVVRRIQVQSAKGQMLDPAIKILDVHFKGR